MDAIYKTDKTICSSIMRLKIDRNKHILPETNLDAIINVQVNFAQVIKMGSQVLLILKKYIFLKYFYI